MARTPTVFSKFELPTGEPIPSDKRGLGPSAQLTEFKPAPVEPKDVVGRRVEEIVPYAGTYGMGGPGFFAMRLDQEWLVVALWSADNWLIVDGRAVGDAFYDNYDRQKPWISEEGDDLSPHLMGASIQSIEITQVSMRIVFDNSMVMSVEEDPRSRPILEGSKELRTFHPDEDLRRGVILSPTTELWI